MQSESGGQRSRREAEGELIGVTSDGQPGGGADANPANDPDRERLLALLREVVARDGRVKAAESLGVSFRTLRQADDTGELTARMEDALKGRLLEDGGAAGAPAARRLHALERRQERLEAALAALAKELGAQLASISGEFAELRKAVPGGERRAEPVGSGERRDGAAGNGGERASAPPAQGVPQPVIGRKPVTKPWRPWPDVVTLEPEEGEELVYGDAAPLIVEWRSNRSHGLDERRSRVERAAARVRAYELELALIGDRELTLPPATYPWDRFDRRRQLRRREQYLRAVRRERRRALCWRFVRRVLTLGLWRR